METSSHRAGRSAPWDRFGRNPRGKYGDFRDALEVMFCYGFFVVNQVCGDPCGWAKNRLASEVRSTKKEALFSVIIPRGAEIVGEHVEDGQEQVHLGQADRSTAAGRSLEAQVVQQQADLVANAAVERFVQRRPVPRDDEHLRDVPTHLLQFRPVAECQGCKWGGGGQT